MKLLIAIITNLMIVSFIPYSHANSLSDAVNDYCNSLGEGLSSEDAKEVISYCIEEQTQYYEGEDDSAQYEEAPIERDCYDEAADALDQDSEADYDKILDTFLNQVS